MRLKDKTTIVTGASHGIGRGIAEAFAAQGAFVLIADIDGVAGIELAREITERGAGVAEFIQTDVSDEAQVRGAVAAAAERGKGRIDVLVNNAAYIKIPWHGVLEVPDDEWEKCFRVSIMGTQYFTKHTLAHMLPYKAGSIINISSVQGLVAARNSTAYTSVKTALVGFTRNVAYDFGPQGIRVNAICPGAIRTRISPAPGSEIYKIQVAKTFLGRTGEVHEVGAAAVFLASDDASYITGAMLPVDGGWTCM